MLKIIHHTPDQLVLRDQRPVASLAAGLVALISILALMIFCAQALELIYRQPNVVQLAGAGLFTLVGVGFVILALMLMAHFAGGITCTLDRHTESLVIRRVEMFRPAEIVHPIYAVARIDVQRNEDVQAFGLFVVLRSGERLPLAAVPLYEEAHVTALARALRAFLYH